MTTHIRRNILPFTAIVGQEQMKTALLLNAVNPKIGGVLIRGDRGTAKSTAVRALAEVLPEINVVKDCPFNCNPNDVREMCESCASKEEIPEYITRKVRVVDLPLGATEDRVLGTIDIEKAIKEGSKSMEPGILAEVNRGILYIDEINLLDDHVADILLDSAAMGINVVEREGISISHPSRFILIGTMNPEEGELRPQLLDRFGLQVLVEGIENVDSRMEIVRTAESFEADPEEFFRIFEEYQETLRQRITRARKILPSVQISDRQVKLTVEACIKLGVKTHRAEITIMRTAKTIAAFNGNTEVSDDDLRTAMELALPHRMRKKPFEEPKLDQDKLNEILDDQNDNVEASDENQTSGPENNSGTSEDCDENCDPDTEGNPNENRLPDRTFAVGRPIDLSKMGKDLKKDLKKRHKMTGRRIDTVSSGKSGYYRSARDYRENNDIAFDATIRAAAPYQKNRCHGNFALSICESDIREKVRVGRVSTACVFVVDASGSMGAMNRMESAKGAVFSMLVDSYQKRDKIGLVAFKGNSADVLMPLCSSVDMAQKCLEELPTGGRTPLSAGLIRGMEALLQEKKKNGEVIPMLVCISDGRSNSSVSGNIKEELISVSEEIRNHEIHTVLIDTEDVSDGFLRMQLGYCKLIAEHTGGSYYSLNDLCADDIYNIASSEKDAFIDAYNYN